MKTVNLEKEKMDLKEVINLTRKEPVLLLMPDGGEFFISGLFRFSFTSSQVHSY